MASFESSNAPVPESKSDGAGSPDGRVRNIPATRILALLGCLGFWRPDRLVSSPERIGMSALIVCIAGLIAFVAVRITASRTRDIDFRYNYAAGVAWQEGLNPYVFEEIKTAYDFPAQKSASQAMTLPLESTFFYAPTAAGWTIPLSWLGLEMGGHVFRAVNTAAAVLVVLLLVDSLRRQLSDVPGIFVARILPYLVGILVVSWPGIRNCIFMGQTSLIVVALLWTAWVFRTSRRPALCGFIVALASFKPSVGLFVNLHLLFERNRRTIVALVLTCLVLASVPLLKVGPVETASTWIKAISTYKTFVFNQPQSMLVFSLQSLLAALGVDYSLTPLLGIAGACWTWIHRRHISALEGFALYMAWYLLFFLNHFYDTVMLIPLFSVAVALARRTRAHLALVMGIITGIRLLPPVMRIITVFSLHRPQSIAPEEVQRMLELVLSVALLGFVLIAIASRIKSGETRLDADVSDEESIAWTPMTVSRRA